MQNGSHQNFGRTSNKPDKGYHIQEITIQTLSRLNLQPEGWNGGIQIQQNGAYKMISKPDGVSHLESYMTVCVIPITHHNYETYLGDG